MKLPVAFFLIILTFSCTSKDETVKKDVKQYSIQQFYKSENVSGGVFNSDETRILVNNNRSGIYNIYEIRLGDTTMTPVTHSGKESFFINDYVPGTNNFIYSSDKGGNENNHLYLVRAGDSARDLTPGVKEKTGFNGWNKAKTALYYNSNKRDPKYFDLYKMDTATWKGEMIYRNDSGLDVNNISFNEQYLLLTKPITTDKNEMYLFDVTKKE